jgi:hypothetical protein
MALVSSHQKVTYKRHYLVSVSEDLCSIPAAGSTFAAFELTRGASIHHRDRKDC